MLTAQAYIPEYAMIASRAAEQHGSGTYRIDQDVVIRKEAEAFIVRETWFVTGENSMRVSFEGRGPLKGLVSGAVLYEGSTKSFYDGQTVRRHKLGDEWLEPFFHFRSSRYLRSRLVSLGVAPQDSLKDRPPLPTEGEMKYEPQSFVRMSRAGGGPAWAIGTNPVVGQSPTLWLEQDQFVVRKYKVHDKLEMRADDYAKYGEKFWYPRSRTYQFGPYTIQIQTVSVQEQSGVSAKDARFKPTTLAEKKETLKLPEVDGLKDFFQRFR